MKLEINITKGKFWALALLGLLVLGMLAYAGVDKTLPWHSADQIEGLDEKLKSLIGPSNFTYGDTCENYTIGRPGTIGTLTGSGGITASCDDGYFLKSVACEDNSQEIAILQITCCKLKLGE